MIEDLKEAGLRVKYSELVPDRENVEKDIPKDLDERKVRLTQYPPRDGVSPGLNVLRRMNALEAMYHEAATVEKAEGISYDLFLVTRDDSYWIGPLKIDHFLSVLGHRGMVFSRGCKQWGGLNDKVLLFGRDAGKQVLSRIYTDFWYPDMSLVTFNAER